MKIFVAVFALISVANAEFFIRTRENLVQYRKECAAELEIDDAHIEQFKKWQYPNDAISQCYLRCVFTKFDLFNEKSGFLIENIHQQLLGHPFDAADHADDEIHKKIISCIDTNTQGSPICEWVYRGAMCFFKNNLQLVQHSVQPQPQA